MGELEIRIGVLAGSVATAVLAMPAPAGACPASDSITAIIHSAIPTSLPREALALQVEFGEADEETLRSGLRARVLQVRRGRFEGLAVLVRWLHSTSCSSPFANGTSGPLIGYPRGMEDGIMVLEPIEVRKGDYYLMRPLVFFRSTLGQLETEK